MSEQVAEAQAPAFPGAPETPQESVASPDVNYIQPGTPPEPPAEDSGEGEGVVYGSVESDQSAQPTGESSDPAPAPTPAEPEWIDLDESGAPLVTNLAGEKETIRAYRNRVKLKTGAFLEQVAAEYGRPFTGMNQWRVEKNQGKRKKASVAEVGACQTVLQRAEQSMPAPAPTAEATAESASEVAPEGAPAEESQTPLA